MLSGFVAPVLMTGSIVLLTWAVRHAGGLGYILAQSAQLQKGKGEFWALFPAALTANVGYWATLSLNIPDFTRYARSQRSQVLGQALGLPTTMTAFAFVGVAVTSATIVMFGDGHLGSDRSHHPHRIPGGHHRGGGRRPVRAAPHQYGGEHRLAGERLLVI